MMGIGKGRLNWPTTSFAVFLVAKLNKSGIVELVVVELRLRLKLKRIIKTFRRVETRFHYLWR